MHQQLKKERVEPSILMLSVFQNNDVTKKEYKPLSNVIGWDVTGFGSNSECYYRNLKIMSDEVFNTYIM